MPGSECVSDRSIYAKKDELLSVLDRVHTDLASAFESVSDDVLASPFPVEEWRDFFPTLADAAVYVMTHHEGYHLGQITQWRRAAGLCPAEG